MKDIERRLEKLERADTVAARYFVFAGDTETSTEVIARRFPDGVARGAEVMVLRWSVGP